jgi:hypothetical protein
MCGTDSEQPAHKSNVCLLNAYSSYARQSSWKTNLAWALCSTMLGTMLHLQ